MTNTAEILDQGFACLVEHLGVIGAERFIALIQRNDFDYSSWQRTFFDKLPPGAFAAGASDYAKKHPYTGNGQVL